METISQLKLRHVNSIFTLGAEAVLPLASFLSTLDLPAVSSKLKSFALCTCSSALSLLHFLDVGLMTENFRNVPRAHFDHFDAALISSLKCILNQTLCVM